MTQLDLIFSMITAQVKKLQSSAMFSQDALELNLGHGSRQKRCEETTL